jgi:hypothetical protein
MPRTWVTISVCAFAAASVASATNLVTVWEATGTYELEPVGGYVLITGDYAG